MQQSRPPFQEASRLSQWAVEPWTVEQSTCLIPPPTTWRSACPSVDKRVTPVKSPKVNISDYVVICNILVNEGIDALPVAQSAI